MQCTTKQASENTGRPDNTKEAPTILSDLAYPGPSKEQMVLSSMDSAGPQSYSITIEGVVKGFRDLGRDMTASETLTMVLRALAKDESEALFDWLLWERSKNDPPADGKGHWEQLCAVIPDLDKSWHSLLETYEAAVCDCSQVTADEFAGGPTVTWSTISPNSNRHFTPSSPVQPPSSPTTTLVRSPLASRIAAPIGRRRKRSSSEPSFQPATAFLKPPEENEAQEGSIIQQHSKRAKMPPAADLPTSS